MGRYLVFCRCTSNGYSSIENWFKDMVEKVASNEG